MANSSRRHVSNAAVHGKRAVKAVRHETMEAGREALNGMTDQIHDVFDAGRTQVTDLAECAGIGPREAFTVARPCRGRRCNFRPGCAVHQSLAVTKYFWVGVGPAKPPKSLYSLHGVQPVRG